MPKLFIPHCTIRVLRLTHTADADKRYCGFDSQIHTAGNFTNYTGLSLWDTFRALNPLLTIVQPSTAFPILSTACWPSTTKPGCCLVWPLCASETNCMIGYHAVPVIVDAYFKGIRGFDVDKASEAMKASAMQDEFGIKISERV